MGFGLKTPNDPVDIQKKKLFLGSSMEDKQVIIWGVLIAIGAYFIIFANITFWWKAGISGLLFSIGTSLSIMKNGKTLWEHFRMFIRKKTTGNVSVDRGADYSYFIRKK